MKNRLSESEERELIRRAKAGDDGARNRLWEAFFPFALTECRKQADLANLDADIAEGEALGNTGGDKSLRSAAPNALQHLFGASAAWRHHGGDARTPSLIDF